MPVWHWSERLGLKLTILFETEEEEEWRLLNFRGFCWIRVSSFVLNNSTTEWCVISTTSTTDGWKRQMLSNVVPSHAICSLHELFVLVIYGISRYWNFVIVILKWHWCYWICVLQCLVTSYWSSFMCFFKCREVQGPLGVRVFQCHRRSSRLDSTLLYLLALTVRVVDTTSQQHHSPHQQQQRGSHKSFVFSTMYHTILLPSALTASFVFIRSEIWTEEGSLIFMSIDKQWWQHQRMHQQMLAVWIHRRLWALFPKWLVSLTSSNFSCHSNNVSLFILPTFLNKHLRGTCSSLMLTWYCLEWWQQMTLLASCQFEWHLFKIFEDR